MVKKAPLPKICHTYPAIMKFCIVIPYLRKRKKNRIQVIYPLSSADSSIFRQESANLALSRNKGIGFFLISKF